LAIIDVTGAASIGLWQLILPEPPRHGRDFEAHGRAPWRASRTGWIAGPPGTGKIGR
jgi:hypothetical protein